jgi:predicted AlkP superfamily phosphohydrolase/phosphomutase
MQQGPLWILSWDGATPWLIDRALAEGVMPNLARMRARGSGATGSTADHPDVATPPGHAVLWTGHPASRNGITSFKLPALPYQDHDLLQTISGFDAQLLLKDPLWITAAREGLHSTLVHAPLSGPVEAWNDPQRYPDDLAEKLHIFHGYGPLRFPTGLADCASLRAPQDWQGLPFSLKGAKEFQYRSKPLSLPALILPNEAGEYDRIYLARDKRAGSPGVFVYPGEEADFSEFLPVEENAGVRFRLFHLAPDASKLLLFSTDGFAMEASSPSQGQAYRKALGGFCGGGSYRAYGSGAMGPLFTDGVAEERYMETHRQGMEHFTASSAWCTKFHPAELMIFYHPGIDEAQHHWAGYVAKGQPCFDAARAKLVWPLLREAHKRADDHLGVLLDRLPKDGTLMLVSDHGITGIHRHFLPNVALREAGLLHTVRGNPYRIDMKRTRAIYHPANNSYVFLNTKEHRKGIVEEHEREELLEEVRDVLQAVKDPDTGKSVLAHTLRIDSLPENSEMRGQGRGDLFLALRPGYSLGETLHRKALLPAHLAGHHQQHPGLISNHALFECLGPRIRRNHRIGVISHRDIHETARHLLGLPPGDGGGEILYRLLQEEG